MGSRKPKKLEKQGKSKSKKLPRFNKWVVGRAGILFRRGMKRKDVVEYFFKRYGKKWKISSLTEMEDFLFTPRPGGRPNFGKLFEGKSEEEIRENFNDFMKKARARDESLRKLNEDPEFARARSERSREIMRRLNKDPEFARARDERLRKLNEDPEFARARDERLRKLNEDPEFVRKKSMRTKRLWRDPEWRKNQVKLIRLGLKKYWTNVRSNLLRVFREKGLSVVFEKKSQKIGRKGKKEKEVSMPVVVDEKSALKNVLSKEKQRVVQKAIENLSSIQRELIVSLFFENNSPKQAMENMGIDKQEFEKLLSQALTKLAPKLKKVL